MNRSGWASDRRRERLQGRLPVWAVWVLGGMSLVYALGASAAPDPDPWDEVRNAQIDPLSAMLHHHFPDLLKEGDLTTLLRFYATETGTGLGWESVEAYPTDAEPTHVWRGESVEESIRERYEKLLALFANVDSAELRINQVYWREESPAGYPATVHLLLRGIAPSGDRLRLDQYMDLTVRFFDPFWEITSEHITDRTVVTLARAGFERIDAEAGIDTVHANVESPPFILFGREEDNPIRQASGVAAGDFDGDGCDDLALSGSPDFKLYRNRCDGTFEDVTATSGLPNPYPAAASGVVFFDYDNDGWSDLFVTAVKGGDRIFRNDGGKRFVDVTEASGIPAGVWGSMPVVADYDRDGLLDVYVVRMGDHGETAPKPPYDAQNGVRGTLLRNLGEGRFKDVTRKAGVGSRGWDMAGAWGDYDGDGWPDLYVANEFGNNRLYRNEGDGTFSNRTKSSGTEDGGSGMGATWADYDADGDLDLFVSGMYANSRWILFHEHFPLPVPWHAKLLALIWPQQVQRVSDKITDRLSRGNTLYRNEGDGTFTDVSDEAAVRDGQWGWGAEFIDYDNNGRLDLYAVNGFLSGPIKDDL
jgi:hypothetical protein